MLFPKAKSINPYFILGLIIIFIILGFGSAYYIQDQKINALMIENNDTINFYDKKINLLNDNISDIRYELSISNKKIIDTEAMLNQKNSEYDIILKNYLQLNSSYYVLLNEYKQLEHNYMIESEIFINKTNVNDNYTRVYFNGITFEYPQNLMTSLSGLYDSYPSNRSGLFSGTSSDEETIITLSWNYIPDKPDLNTTLKDAYETIKKDVKKIGVNSSIIKDEFIVYYSNYTVKVDRETKYMLISTWYLNNTSHHYLCMVQQDENTVIKTFKELIASFYKY